MLTSKEIAHLAVKALDDKLARDIQILKTDKVTVLADYFILCTAGNSTHGKTLADEVDKVLSQAGEQPLRREGYSRRRSFLLGQASGLVEPVSGVIGALLVVTVEAILPYALAFAAGAMILVAVHELIPECQQNQKEQPYCATMGIILGFAAMMLLDVMLG